MLWGVSESTNCSQERDCRKCAPACPSEVLTCSCPVAAESNVLLTVVAYSEAMQYPLPIRTTLEYRCLAEACFSCGCIRVWYDS